MKIERTRDEQLIRQIATADGVWEHVHDDQYGNKADYTPLMDERVIYLLASEGTLVMGMFMLMPQNGITAEVHTCMLPHCRGRDALEAAWLATEWTWANTNFLRVVTTVPSYNRPALLFSKLAGMREYGVNPKSIMKDGVLHDQHLLGRSKCQ